MKNVHQLQAIAQESVKALDAFESLLRNAVPILEKYAKLTNYAPGEGVRNLIDASNEALNRWAK